MPRTEPVLSDNPTDVLHICALAYHEITEDPRIWKEALALRKRGHRVTVFCNSPSDLPRQEEIDGIEIVRFAAYDHAHISQAELAGVDHMGSAREAVMARLGPYLDRVELLHRHQQPFREYQQVTALQLSYKEKRGLKRLMEKLRYKRAKRKLANDWKHLGDDLEMLKNYSKVMRLAGKDLYQTNGYVFAMNLMRVIDGYRPDVVHAHDIYCLPAGVAFARRTDAKLIYDAHEYEPSRATRMAEDASNIADVLELDCLRYVDHLITVSGNIQKLYAERFDGPAPTIVYNAPPTPEVSLQDGDIRALSGVTESVPLLVFTGGVQRENRGVDKVLEAMVTLPKVHLAILGPRNRFHDTWLMEIAEKLGVSHRVHLVPGVDAALVAQTISTADAAVIPIQDVALSYRYCMPNKLFESAFAGIPVVASNLPDMRAFIEEMGIGVTVDQTDPQSLADGIRTVLEDPARFRLDDAGWTRLRDAYSWEAQERKLVAIAEGLCAERVAVDA